MLVSEGLGFELAWVMEISLLDWYFVGVCASAPQSINVHKQSLGK